MTEVIESGTGSAAPKDPKTYKCRWSNCKEEHTVDIDPDYPEGGKTTKTTSGDDYYRTLWTNGMLRPWDVTGGLPRLRYRVQAVNQTKFTPIGTCRTNMRLKATT